MKVEILQKNNQFSGFEFLPENVFDNLKLRTIMQRLKDLNVKIKHLETKELKEESLIVRLVPIL